MTWSHSTLGSVAKIQSGAGFPIKYQGVKSEKYHFYKVSDMNLPGNEIIMFNTTNTISESTRKTLRGNVFPKDSIIFPKVGGAIGTNKKRIVSADCCADNNIMGLVPNFYIIHARYLYYFMHTFDLIDMSNKSNPPSIRQSTVENWPIPLPPLPEQQRIVAILDEAFGAIATAKANAEKNLKNARELFESHLQAVFTQRGEGWGEKTLAELGTITSSKRIFKNEYVKFGIPFFRTKEVKELANGREISTELFISMARYEEIKTKFGVPKKGDILLTAIGTIGEVYVVEGEKDFYFKDGNVLWLKDFTAINSHFLKYVLISFVERLNKMAHGSAYSALPIQRLNTHRIFLPSPVEQDSIVSQLDSLLEETHRLATLYQQKLAALDELKKSLLHKAFSGNL